MYVHIPIFATLHHMTLILINTETSKMKLEISVLCSLFDFGEYLIPSRFKACLPRLYVLGLQQLFHDVFVNVSNFWEKKSYFIRIWNISDGTVIKSFWPIIGFYVYRLIHTSIQWLHNKDIAVFCFLVLLCVLNFAKMLTSY